MANSGGELLELLLEDFQVEEMLLFVLNAPKIVQRIHTDNPRKGLYPPS